MQLRNEIPDTFWSLFRSVNREIYIDALLYINEEYQYNNYFLTKEACIQILGDMNAGKRYELQWEESESEFDMLETPSSRILNWLLRTGWLKRIEDYNTLVTNIVIPDYSAIFIDAFERLSSEDMEETDIYIQNVYATLFSFQNDARANLGMLRTALVNTRRLNKALQDMLHNMDKFFARLLDQKSYGDLLREHLDGYVEEIVRKKYHILKTSDNEHRIANMDKEHTKYVRATVTRLNYLLSGESDTKGLVVKLLNRMSESADYDEVLAKTGEKMNLSLLEILSEKSLYKRRKGRRYFISQMEPDEEIADLDKEDVLKLNRIQVRYTKEQIEAFIESHMDQNDIMDAAQVDITDEESFEKLILAYDYSTRGSSKYMVLEEEPKMIEKGPYKYPALKFVRRRL